MEKRKQTDNSHLIVEPEGRGKTIVVSFLVLVLIALTGFLIISQIGIDLSKLVPQQSETRTSTKQSHQPKKKRKVEHLDWTLENFMALEVGAEDGVVMSKVVATFGEPARKQGDTQYYYETKVNSPFDGLTLHFEKSGDDYRLVNKTAHFKEQEATNWEKRSEWTKTDYDQLSMMNPTTFEGGITYEEVVAQFGTPNYGGSEMVSQLYDEELEFTKSISYISSEDEEMQLTFAKRSEKDSYRLKSKILK